jgi:hypothetical protein
MHGNGCAERRFVWQTAHFRFPSLDRVPAKNLSLLGPTETRGPMPPVPRAVHASKLKLYHPETHWREVEAPTGWTKRTILARTLKIGVAKTTCAVE